MQQHVPAAEWATAEETARRSFALQDLAFLLPWAAGLDRATRDRASATAGPSFRVLYRRLTRGRFERSEAAALRRT